MLCGLIAAILTLWTGTCSAALAQANDTNGDGMSDVWQRAYSITNINQAHEDTDEDGLSNLVEAHAGTNPHDPNSHTRIDAHIAPGSEVQLEWLGVDLKQYRLQTSLNFSTWLDTDTSE